MTCMLFGCRGVLQEDELVFCMVFGCHGVLQEDELETWPSSTTSMGC